ncbi:D-amino acid oxidase, putative [Talaromyces stipitatus ATCC 10500]|uniref:D-amino acid oxidase, putative n=1 Tax=Talaromyces stipitatus (strain ATCC 10500 / CBS 375.48 / QM 6759 / NRRL 1006) TaxID=441959 RepID=B8LTF7_TALSN|nr:D-amino acid oxidase, putative [Talaromyces stipitatus ATCC 10500]EED23035.1 D-amino acid oxidase, putative [Talaromyces stipitatus ATCC 10500]
MVIWHLVRSGRVFPKIHLDHQIRIEDFAKDRRTHSTYEFTTVCINTAIYLPWLLSKCLGNGVAFKRAVVEHVTDAACLHENPGHVGQVVVVRNDPGVMTTVSNTTSGQNAMVYMMCRPGGKSFEYTPTSVERKIDTRHTGGGSILGGCYQVNNWEESPDTDLAENIKRGCVTLYPALTQGQGVDELSIIRHGVGFRPLRPQGVRIETEYIRGIPVVHNYGHGGWGYQSSYGCTSASQNAKFLNLCKGLLLFSLFLTKKRKSFIKGN